MNDMKHFFKILALLLVVTAASGCSKIPDLPQSSVSETVETTESEETGEAETPIMPVTDIPPTEYRIDKQEVSLKLNAEGGVFAGEMRSDGEFDGEGYVMLEGDQTLLHIADVPSAQHYKIIIAATSYTGAAIRLSDEQGDIGTYYIPPNEEFQFSQYAIDSVYLTEGSTFLTFALLDGYVSIDYILVEDGEAAASSCYKTEDSVVGKNTGIHTIGTMKYLSNMYGARVMTAQNVTPGTNTEIDAVYAVTERYPAMRCGDLMYSSLYAGENNAEKAEKEVGLALDWGRNGGIVSLGWHWYAPTDEETHFYKNGTEFSIDGIYTERDVALASIEEVEGLADSDMIPRDCYLLIKDIDNIAEVLKSFKNEYMTVVWQPLPDGDTDLYWWGGSAENYKWLWRLMFTRMNEYHGLNNLIWVWNGSNAEYYPGDAYCDIIGQGMYLGTSASYASRFEVLAHTSTTCVKPVAVTSCDVLTDINHMNRDNAMWLWVAPASGEYTVGVDGKYSGNYTNADRLYDTYNSQLCITRDELPDFSSYALDITESDSTEEQ